MLSVEIGAGNHQRMSVGGKGFPPVAIGRMANLDQDNTQNTRMNAPCVDSTI